jgi:hypothetical protein
MIDTQESDLTPAVAAAIGPLHTTRRGLVRSGMFAEIETMDIVSGTGFSGSHPRPAAVFDAPREAKSFSTRSSAAPKVFDNSRGDVSGIDTENIALTVVRRTAVCDKNFDQPSIVSSGNQRQNFAPAAPTLRPTAGRSDDPER